MSTAASKAQGLTPSPPMQERRSPWHTQSGARAGEQMLLHSPQLHTGVGQPAHKVIPVEMPRTSSRLAVLSAFCIHRGCASQSRIAEPSLSTDRTADDVRL